MNAYNYETPLGPIFLVAENEKLIYAAFDDYLFNTVIKETPLLKLANRQLQEYFLGERKEFTIPLSFSGTPFQESVWHGLLSIPYGKTLSYQELAELIKHPRAARAVGNANHKNPISIFVPCHRVIRTGGALGGYGGGLDRKAYLLNLEQFG